ncbi:SMC-Scp complex subunit ScpB [Aminivibrio sp.]|jgi:segregation and condensation protein B|uniref:SMC-Scp complex subunit ScpB n=1 Tax=Aminivibrio sp. TaxID=1872489 RepID=UPI001A4802EC|nr:SMC-Scp complex subunit ScpB [Aminivibrio sp.]MBL3538570.1 SMC-Scp complex subunit ScpB [Aminivibrio sp.]
MCSYTVSEGISDIGRRIQAILFVAGSPVGDEELASVLSLPLSVTSGEIKILGDFLRRIRSGVLLQKSAGGWRMVTAEDVADSVSLFRDTARTQKIRLSRAAVETLAVIAYNQPVTRSEVEDIRGVRCERVIETLLSHGMIRIAGRKKGTGSPLLYRTTDIFLETFGLSSISELPTLEELQELAPPPEEKPRKADALPVEENDEQGEEDDLP